MAETFVTIVPFSQSLLQEKQLTRIIHNGSWRDGEMVRNKHEERE